MLIIKYLKQNIQGTKESFEKILNLGKSATINILNEMLEREIIEKIGLSKNIVYKLKQNNKRRNMIGLIFIKSFQINLQNIKIIEQS